MHRIVPELIMENCRAGRDRGTFRAASMFLDISGFSGMTDALMGQGRDGAEVLAVTMRAVFDPLVEAVFSQGGMIVGYAGDSISALYPADVDETLAARRALASAHSIQRRLAADPSFDTPFGTFRISAKIGLAFGSVTWGILRSPERDRAVYYFRGDAVEAASRAEQQACPGDVILTGAIRELLRSNAETTPLADFHGLVRVSGELPAAQTIALPPVDASTAALFAPAEIITGNVQGEFRQTVHLFMRVPDLGAEQLQQFMSAFFGLQARYGGLIDRIDFGDKGCTMTVVWGAPVAQENDIDRALSLVLDLKTEVDVPVTAGITYYISYAGYVGGRLFETYTTYGWGISMAARFMMRAVDNQVWLDDRIAQRVKERFHVELVGEQTFKGFAQKQKIHALCGRKAGPQVSFRGRMVGRESELHSLADFVAPMWDGKYAGVLGIWGEGGIGKSRLLYEFQRSPVFQGRSCTWAVCQTDEMLRRSFNPFRSWLSQHFEILAARDRPARQQDFLARLDALIAVTEKASLAGELTRARWFLAALLGLEWPDSAYEQLDAQGRYDNTIIALISLLKAEARRQPLILILEDAHYLDEDSRAFLPRLKRSFAADPVSYPMAIIMTTRWAGTKVFLEDGLIDQDVDLTGLTNESISSLASEFLGGPAASALVSLINERAEGNPFFAEQILRYLREQDLLELSSAGEWVTKPSGQSSALPMDVSAMLVSRLDKLPGGTKDVIQAASVLGRAFDLPVLARMIPHESPLQVRISAAERAAIWSPLGETRYVFNHALLRDVAYNMQLQSRRQELHALAFEALRNLFGSEVHRHYGDLAYHSEQAGLADEARRYLELAGDAARDEYHNAQAVDFYRRALALHSATDIRDRYRLHRECEKIVSEHGTLEERIGEVDALQSLADANSMPGQQAEVMLLRSRLLSSSGNNNESAQLAERAKDLALRADRHDVAIGACMSLLVAFYQQGMYKEAMEHGEAGIALARRHNAAQQEAFILNWLGLAFLEMKNPSAARTYFEQSLSMFRAEDNVRGVARVLTNLGSVAGYQGNYTTALDYFEQSLRLAREIGSRTGECRLLANIGWVCGLLGDYQKAKAYAEHNLQIAREIGDRYTQTISLTNLSSHAGATGEFASAIEYAELGLSLARGSNDRNLQAWALTYLGHGLLESGMLEPALRAYQEAMKLRHELEQPVLATEPAASIALIYSLKGDPESARPHINAILTELEQDGTLEGTDQPLRVYLNCYLVLSDLRDERAKALLNTAHDMLKTRANGISDPSARRVFLENITYNRELLRLWEQRRREE